jgi:SAM-dependent methyltransferase
MNLYESKTLQHVTGPALRPGGIELTQQALDYCRLGLNARVLDVGCGLGTTVEYLGIGQGLNAFGIDLSENLLKKGKQRTCDLLVSQARAATLPFGSALFDAVFCECVLTVLPDPASALAEFRRILKPDGYLVISDLYRKHNESDEDWGSIPVNSCLNGAVSRTCTEDRLRRTGFTPVLWEDHTDKIKLLAARIIFSYGSMKNFWAVSCGQSSRSSQALINVTARPGYGLSISRTSEYVTSLVN